MFCFFLTFATLITPGTPIYRAVAFLPSAVPLRRTGGESGFPNKNPENATFAKNSFNHGWTVMWFVTGMAILKKQKKGGNAVMKPLSLESDFNKLLL
jgi:hypothetical protein